MQIKGSLMENGNNSTVAGAPVGALPDKHGGKSPSKSGFLSLSSGTSRWFAKMRGERYSLLRPPRDGVGSPVAVETIRLRLLNWILLFLLLNLFLGRVQDDRDPLPVLRHLSHLKELTQSRVGFRPHLLLLLLPLCDCGADTITLKNGEKHASYGYELF